MKANKKEIKTNQPIIVNNINVQSVDRTKKDIASFKIALQNAESKHSPNRTRLYDLYEDIKIDTHLTGITNKRINKLLNKSMYFEDSKGVKIEDLNTFCKSKEFRKLKKTILKKLFYGLVGMEFIPSDKLKIEEIPVKHIKPEKKIIATHQNNNTSGFDYADNPRIVVLGDDEEDFGMWLHAAPWVLWKRGSIADWSQFIEIFGQPTRIGRYDSFDINGKKELQEALDAAGSSLAITVPKNVDFEFKDGKQASSDGALQDNLRKAANEEMSVLILGNTETTASSSSSGYAQSQTHQEGENEIIASDMEFLLGELNDPKILNILKSYGLNIQEGGSFVFEEEISTDKVAAKLDIIEKAKNLGVPIDDDVVYDTTKIPKPANYDKIKSQQENSNVAQETNNTQKDTGNKETIKPSKTTDNKKIKEKALVDKIRSLIADFFDPALKG